MEVGILFKMAAIGIIITVIVGLIIVLAVVVGMVGDLFGQIKDIFQLG